MTLEGFELQSIAALQASPVSSQLRRTEERWTCKMFTSGYIINHVKIKKKFLVGSAR